MQENKNKSKKGTIFNILISIFLVLFIVSASVIVYVGFIEPQKADSSLQDINSELLDIVESEENKEAEIETDFTESEVILEQTSNETTKEEPESEDKRQRRVIVTALNQLKSIYEDLEGWIVIDNTVVNFPVMQSSKDDPDYYLRRDYKGNYSRYGSIYLDSNCSPNSGVSILYGHSMSDKRMFYCLLDMADPEILKDSPIIKYDTLSGVGDYKIVSIFKTNTKYSHGAPFNYIDVDFKSDEEKMQYVYECMIRSVVDTGVDIDDEDDFILLSTCSYEFDDFRTAVLARKVRPNEESSVDINNIKASENPLYPDVWYKTYGTKKPYYPETLREAVNEGLADWYIGDLLK